MADSVDELFPGPMMADEAVEEPMPVEEPVEAPAEPESEPAPEPTPEPEAQSRHEEPQRVPLSVMMEERERRKEAERRIAAMEAQQRQPVPQPDPFDDPAGFAQHQQEAVDARLWQHTVALSDHYARQQFGDEKTEAAMRWADDKLKSDPAFAMQARQQISPVTWIVQQHQRDAMVSEIGDRSMDDFVRDYIARNPGLLPQSATAPAPAVVAPVSAPAPARVPRSLASQGTAPSDVRQTATGPLAGVDALFG